MNISHDHDRLNRATRLLLLRLRPSSNGDWEKLDIGLRQLMAEDPTLSVDVNARSASHRRSPTTGCFRSRS